MFYFLCEISSKIWVSYLCITIRYVWGSQRIDVQSENIMVTLLVFETLKYSHTIWKPGKSWSMPIFSMFGNVRQGHWMLETRLESSDYTGACSKLHSQNYSCVYNTHTYECITIYPHHLSNIKIHRFKHIQELFHIHSPVKIFPIFSNLLSVLVSEAPKSHVHIWHPFWLNSIQASTAMNPFDSYFYPSWNQKNEVLEFWQINHPC